MNDASSARLWLVLALLFLTVAGAGLVEAGEWPKTIAVEYAFMTAAPSHDGLDLSDLHTAPVGFVLSLGIPVARPADIVVEMGASFDLNSRKRAGPFGQEVGTVSVVSVLGGLRLTGRNPKANVALQFLAGIESASAANEGESDPAAAIQPGVLVELKIGDRTSWRLGADYRFVTGFTQNRARLHTGIVIALR